ncbi:hypothetical protein O6H91_06G046300 [Diphasiastrum complanatum]|uniref:Uncharacterized protein n=3 Tax=Diphasiastrum complanatum TaxID=34168 RepID=A0ACC2DDC4_DIPCM|nr:hypothetical protein O6H91_06G046300 [Diphasiastrum complanatum]KAJ7552216.1 hypothetical protein O6H91_06G046300 [Diphasiastrum complanatum]KAJ7552217.1 hypothetical protein O6H91_06G046300 [Diphasiastrum complanatum]
MSALAENNSTKWISCTSYNQEVKSTGENQTGNAGQPNYGWEIAGSQDLPGNPSSCSFCEFDKEDSGDDEGVKLWPLVPLIEKLERVKDDESLRNWKEQLLGSLYLDPPGEDVEPEVILTDIKIVCEGRDDIIIPLPLTTNLKGHIQERKRHLFSLKEGSRYRLTFTFFVRHNLVPGLTFINTVWKNGLKVDHSKVMLGTFSPHLKPYIHSMEEDITPTGILVRGAYTAKTKFVDDDKRCHFELNYSFEIRRHW